MRLDIKRNNDGLYKLKSTVSNDELNDGWITENEVKKILVERALWKFAEDVIRIDMEFPSGYHVNDRFEHDREKAGKGSRWLLDNWDGEVVEKKFKEICQKLDVEI